MNNNEVNRRPSLWVWLAALSALMGPMCMGAILGWTAPALPDMSKGTAPNVTENSKTWIGSSVTLGALAGGLLGGPTYQILGGKKSMIGLGPIFTIGWIVIWISRIDWLVILGRVICGFASGMICGVAPTYCIQLSTPSIRGLLGTGFQIFVVIGILYIDVFGLFCSWRWLCLVGLIPGALMTVSMLFMPESPCYLIKKFGRCSQAVDALRKLRQSGSDIELELKELEESVEQSSSDTGLSMSQLLRPDFYKPLMISIFLMVFQRLSGINAIYFYMTDIFKESGSAIDPNVSTCMVGALLVLATICSGVFGDRFGRRFLLLISSVGEGISLGVLGYYYYITRSSRIVVNTTIASVSSNTLHSTSSSLASTTSAPEADNSLGWLPLVCIIVFVVMFSIGFGPIPWLIVSEITPGFALAVVSSISTCAYWTSIFIITKFFVQFEEDIKPYGAFWLLAAICVASIIFVVLFVPETKGKSVEEMQKIFLGENVMQSNVTNNKVISRL